MKSKTKKLTTNQRRNLARKSSRRSTFTVNPFVSEAQRRACYAANDPNWDCHEWSEATGDRKLPKRKKATNNAKAKAFRPNKIDPTRTTNLRNAFSKRLRKLFARLKGKIVHLIVKEDALGLGQVQNTFCATGEGGGIDPTCSPTEGSWKGGNVEVSGSLVHVSADPTKEGLERWASKLPNGNLKGLIHEGKAYVWDVESLGHDHLARSKLGMDSAPYKDRFYVAMVNGKIEINAFTGAHRSPDVVKLGDKLGITVNSNPLTLNYQPFTFNGNTGWFPANGLIEVPDIRQEDHYSCGAAAAMSVGKYFGVGPDSLEEWKGALGTDVEESTRPDAIREYLTSLGLEVEVMGQVHDAEEWETLTSNYEVPPDILSKLSSFLQEGMPVICPVQDYGPRVPKGARFEYGHYLVVIGRGMGYIFAQDPSADNVVAGGDDKELSATGSIQKPGRVMIAEEDFVRVWHDKDIDGNRYIGYGITVGSKVTGNVFCPTGEGGGVDPSCEKSSGGKKDVEVEQIKQAIPSITEWKSELTEQAGCKVTSKHLNGMCEGASETLSYILDERGISTRMVEGSYKGKDHFWLEAKNGSIIDATEGQFDKSKPPGHISVYPKEDPKYVAKKKSMFSLNTFCPTGEGGGVDPSCSPGGSAAIEPAKGLLFRTTVRLSKLADKVPGIKQVKNAVSGAMKAVHTKLAARYGEKAATVIMTSGGLGGYGVAGVSFALTGIPGIPVVNDIVSITAHTAVAEAVLQFGRLKRKLTGNEWYDGPTSNEDVWAEIRGVAEAAAREHASSISAALHANPELMREAEELVAEYHREVKEQVTTNTRWAFSSDPAKIEAFQQWLATQLAQDLLSQTEEQLWQKFAFEGFKKGAGRAFDDVRMSELAQRRPELFTPEHQASVQDFYAGTKDEFLRSSFAHPVAIDKIKLLASRSFDEMENVTRDMGVKMSRVLTDGLVQGKSPREIARLLNQQVDLGQSRALTVSRTEIIRAHAEGQLEALDKLGVEEVGVMVEWSTSGMGMTKLGNPSPCEECSAMAGTVLTLEEARGMIPAHPNCMCAWIPANVGEDTEGQVRGKAKIEKAAASVDMELNPIAKVRPKAVVNTVQVWVTNEKLDDASGHWVTLEDGQHVFIGGDGSFLPSGPKKEGESDVNYERRTGSEPDKGGSTGPSRPLAGEAKGSAVTEAAKAGHVEIEPAGKGPAGRVPVTLEEANAKISRMENLFRQKGQHEAAEWMGKLREHVNAVGTEESLKALGEQQGTGSRMLGERVQFEADPFGGMSHFTAQYLDRHGVTPVHTLPLEERGQEKVLSTVTKEYEKRIPGIAREAEDTEKEKFQSVPGSHQPVDPTLKDKLAEAKALPGLEKSEDINKLMGKPVTHMTQEVMDKLDSHYGKDRWIVKPFGDIAYGGQGIYFPQKANSIKEDAKATIHESEQGLKQYGFTLGRDQNGKAIGLQHSSGDVYPFGSKEYKDTIHGHARELGDKAENAAPHEKGAELPAGGKDFMAQPAFKAVGVSDADRAAGVTIAPGEGRVHITTKNGVAEILPHSTWIKGEHLPVVFENDDTKAMAKAAVDAINAMPKSERMGQIYAPDVMKTDKGYRVVEANPANYTGFSGYMGDNPLIIDAYASHVTGREPAHVQFIRKLLSKRMVENYLAWLVGNPGGDFYDYLTLNANNNPEGCNQYKSCSGSADERAKQAYDQLYGPNKVSGFKQRKELEKEYKSALEEMVKGPSPKPLVEQPQSKPTSSSQESVTGYTDKVTATVERLGKDNYNLTHLGDVRAAHPELGKDQFDQVIQEARKQGKISLVPAEGRQGTTERDRQAAIHEVDPLTGRRDKMFLYASHKRGSK